MGDLRSLERSQRSRDNEHLALLSTFHFVGVGLAVAGIGMLYGHYALFHSLTSKPNLWPPKGVPPLPVDLFTLMKWVYVVMAIGIACSGALNLLSALFLRARRHWTFSLVVAGLNCLYTPLGTVLGIFTIVVLVRDSVRDLYRAEPEQVS